MCPLEDYQKDVILFVPRAFTSHKSNSLIRNYVEFSGWRLFGNNQSIPVAEYNQFGTNTFFKKIFAFFPNSMGINDDNSHSLCSLSDDFEPREQTRTDLYLEIDRTYKVGRYVRYGENWAPPSTR